MTVFDAIGLLIAVGLVVYLGVALVRPETFE